MPLVSLRLDLSVSAGGRAMGSKESVKLSPKARLPLAIIFSGLFILVVIGCAGMVLLFNTWLDTGFWGWPYHGTRLRLVENELHSTVSTLPQSDQLHLLATYDEFFQVTSTRRKNSDPNSKKKGFHPATMEEGFLFLVHN